MENGARGWVAGARLRALAFRAGAAALAVLWLTLLPPTAPDALFGQAAAAVAAEPSQHPAASAAWTEQTGDRAKLIFEISAPVDAAAFVLSGPDRVIVDLPQTDFGIGPEIGKPERLQRRKAGLIASFRFGQLQPGKSRIVIDLNAPARVVRADCERKETDGRARLIVELAKSDPESFRLAVQNARAQLARLAQTREGPKPEPATTRPLVMLDPGHGGIDRGAMVKGLVEKELVFEFAKALEAKLEADGSYRVAMTREDDSFVPLSGRMRMARDANAALFVSIHADTLSEAADVSGATVYTLSDRASDAEAARVAEKENQSDAVAGLDQGEDSSGVSEILFDLTRRETRAFSHMFAHALVDYWRAAGRLNKNPRRSAGFRVLRAPDVPSVLIELGYLSNAKDSEALNSPQWRDKATRQVAEAIAAFFSARESNATATKADPDTAPVGKIPPAGR